MWKLGIVAHLKVKDPKVLEDPTLHRIPNAMFAERLKLKLQTSEEDKQSESPKEDH